MVDYFLVRYYKDLGYSGQREIQEVLTQHQINQLQYSNVYIISAERVENSKAPTQSTPDFPYWYW